MIYYIVQTIAFQALFLLIYDVFLKKTTFFNWNRVYLLTTMLLSLLLPFIKIDSFKEIISSNYIIALPEVILGGVKPNLELNDLKDVAIHQSISTLEIIFYLGVIVSSFLFLGKLLNLVKLINRNLKTYKNNLVLVKLLKSNASFSFFKYIFLGEHLNSKEQEAILKHEIIHVKQWHSLDLMFFEVLRIIFWFNPLIYIYQHRITELHEFIADAEAVKNENKSLYYQSLLSQVFDTQQISFINPFFNQSLIKKRIVMLQKSKSKQIHLFKYALLIPLVFGMLTYTSCKAKKQTTANSITTSVSNSKIKAEDSLVDSRLETNERTSLKANENETVSSSAITVVKTEEYIGEDIEVPFTVVEEVPVFPGCENLETKLERKTCFSENITAHVAKTFNTRIADSLGLKGQQRINVIFKVNKEGDIVFVRSRARHLELETEAIRVIKALPKMMPGKQKGKKVTVPYSLPIIFQVQE